MCGRFWLKNKVKGLETILEPTQVASLTESYNIAPGQWVSVIISRFQLKTMKWGLIPIWSQGPQLGYKMINARAETIREKVTYKKLLNHHRCLVPCSGFYEWHAVGRKKQPYLIKLESNEAMTLAGLWTTWRASTGEDIHSFTIITVSANEMVSAIHERMPVIIAGQDRQAWLQSESDERVNGLLQPFSSELLEMFEISDYVNSPEHNDEQCIKPNRLF